MFKESSCCMSFQISKLLSVVFPGSFDIIAYIYVELIEPVKVNQVFSHLERYKAGKLPNQIYILTVTAHFEKWHAHLSVH